MSGSFQRQSLNRKLIYSGVIIVLLCVYIFWLRNVMVAKATSFPLQIREENIGDVKLTDSAVRLSMVGSRGLVVCALWVMAQDKQMKHEWNELELVVNSLTKLQPHFITPWLFQSWNLAYNVSVESDRVKDKYFYVTRGIELLAEGERLNRDDCDLRMNMGLYYQNKLGMADEANTFRSLFQMSCIDPKHRDPERFRQVAGDRTVVNLDQFAEFCREQPHLVRRLRDRLRCDKPERVVEFLAENRDVPGRYVEDPDIVRNLSSSPLKSPEQRFPVLPPQSNFDPSDYTNDSPFPFDFDNFDAARTWYKYSQDPADDPILQRRPRHLSFVIFQSNPARSETYHAEFLEKNGWFDKDGWEIADWFPADTTKPFGAKRTVRVGDDRDWAVDAFKKAFEAYERHGQHHGLLYPPEELAKLDRQKRIDYEYGRHITNFAHFYAKTRVEARPEVVDARKHFYKAEQLRRLGEREKALAEYEHPSAFGTPDSWTKTDRGWKRILKEVPDFRDDQDEQQELYETQVKYMRLLDEMRGPALRALVFSCDLLGQVITQDALRTPVTTRFLPGMDLVRDFPLLMHGPLDGVDANGVPWINPMIVARVRGIPTGMPAAAPSRSPSDAATAGPRAAN